jgi:hypothetical protein
MRRTAVKKIQRNVKEMEFVPSTTRRGKSTFSLRSVSPSSPPHSTASPSPSKSKRGSESPSKRRRFFSPIIQTFGDDNDEGRGGRTTKVGH